MDINPKRLDIIHSFTRRYASEVKADLSFEKTLSHREIQEGIEGASTREAWEASQGGSPKR